ncbi:uncharacterized protein J3R85_010545 [Psidium guajava]|nr:uncharacterized protein J3R85_010545 [Psidium guajava]
MGAANIWNAMEVAGEATESCGPAVPSSPLAVDTSLSLPEMSPRVIELCKDLFAAWSKLDDSRFAVETVSGGITNLLLKVSVKEESGNVESVTVRLYGPNTDYVIDREREIHVSFYSEQLRSMLTIFGFGHFLLPCFLAIKYLSAAGFGAKLLAVFGNGMVQSFINARTLTQEDMRKPKVAAEIAKQLRKFHQVEVPGSKEPQLWNDIFKFFGKASDLKFDDNEKQRKYETISFKEIQDELLELKELTGLLNAPVVFAHNDLLCGNFMFNDEEGKLYFIDFEYGSYNYRGFDIGNHFNEYAGYECDYSLYPSKDEQYHFFRHYLMPDKPQEVSDKDLEAMYIEANTYMLASHLLWALWGLIQAKMSPIDFNYMEYFFLRYSEFKKQKHSSVSLAKSYLTGS